MQAKARLIKWLSLLAALIAVGTSCSRKLPETELAVKLSLLSAPLLEGAVGPIQGEVNLLLEDKAGKAVGALGVDGHGESHDIGFPSPKVTRRTGMDKGSAFRVSLSASID